MHENSYHIHLNSKACKNSTIQQSRAQHSSLSTLCCPAWPIICYITTSVLFNHGKLLRFARDSTTNLPPGRGTVDARQNTRQSILPTKNLIDRFARRGAILRPLIPPPLPRVPVLHVPVKQQRSTRLVRAKRVSSSWLRVQHVVLRNAGITTGTNNGGGVRVIKKLLILIVVGTKKT